MADWLPDEFVAWAGSITFLDGILWIVIGVGVLLFIKRGWPWLKAFATSLMQFVQIVDSVKDLPEFIKRTDESIEVLRHQVQNDHDTNLRDELTTVLDTIGPMSEQLDQLVKSDSAQWREIESTRPTKE